MLVVGLVAAAATLWASPCFCQEPAPEAGEAAAPSGEQTSPVFEETAPPRPDVSSVVLEEGEAPTPEPAPDAEVDPKIRAVNEILDADGGDAPAEEETDTADAGGFSEWNLLWRFARMIAVLCALLGTFVLLFYGGSKLFGKKHPLLAGASLGKVMGRIHLNPWVALHFVKAGDRILVVAVAGKTVSPVAELPLEAFPAETEEPAGPAPAGSTAQPAAKKGRFVELLRASAQRMQTTQAAEEQGGTPGGNLETDGGRVPLDGEDEIAALRDGIQRLQRQIRETSRELDQ